ncbi:hypothetical protein K432DRAFT_303643, partial [Lepidopterella palustris CBS 459.81]
RVSLFKKKRLQKLVIFRKNIILIFKGPKYLKFNSYNIRLRKVLTRTRYKIIRGLSPNRVVL